MPFSTHLNACGNKPRVLDYSHTSCIAPQSMDLKSWLSGRRRQLFTVLPAEDPVLNALRLCRVQQRHGPVVPFHSAQKLWQIQSRSGSDNPICGGS